MVSFLRLQKGHDGAGMIAFLRICSLICLGMPESTHDEMAG